MNNFEKILMCKSKKELKKACKSLTISSDELSDVIMKCKAGIGRLNHTMHFFDFVPSHLETRESDFEILNSPKENQVTAEGKKALTRLFKSHGQRKYKVVHMFFSRETQHPLSEWHMIFFEMDELKEEGNHWRGGPHVHIVNYLSPEYYCQDLWNLFVLEKKTPTGIHIAFKNKQIQTVNRFRVF